MLRSTATRPVRLVCAVFIALLVFCASAALADTIALRTGERLVGKILAEEPGKVIFESQALGRIEVPRERIERIEERRSL